MNDHWLRPIKVYLAHMSEQQRKLLAYYFSSQAQSAYNIVDTPDFADCVFLDHDFPGAENKMHELEADYTGRLLQVVLFSQNLPANAEFTLQKPLSLKQLHRVAARLRSRLAENSARDATMKAPDETSLLHIPTLLPVQSTRKPASPSIQKVLDSSSLTAKLNRETRTRDSASVSSRLGLLYGSLTLTHCPSGILPEWSFEESQYLPWHLREICKTNRNTGHAFSLLTPDTRLCVMPQQNLVACNCSLKKASTLGSIQKKLGKSDIQVEPLEQQNLRAVARQTGTSQVYVYSLDAFIWLTSILVSKGRLPAGTRVKSPLRLRHWPNLTRLENIPHSLDLSAYWSRHTISIQDISVALGLELRFVFAFYSAAHSLELFAATESDRSQKSASLLGKLTSRK